MANFNLNSFIGYKNNHCFPKQILSADRHWAGLPLRNYCVFLKETRNKKLMTFLPGNLVFIFTRGMNSIINVRKISYSSCKPSKNISSPRYILVFGSVVFLIYSLFIIVVSQFPGMFRKLQ